MASIDQSLQQPQRTSGRPPLWGIGLAALLVTAGFGSRTATRSGRSSAHISSNRGARHERGSARHEPGRGRAAETPTEIPAKGWKDILVRVYRRLSEDRIVAIAAGVTFYGLLALFPALAALVSVYGLFADPATMTQHLAAVSNVLPGGGVEVLTEQLNRLAQQGSGTLGVAFVVGLAVSLWSANAGVKAVFDALNVVYGEREKRGFIKLNAISLLFTMATIALVLIAIAAMIVLPILLNYIGLGGMTETLIRVGRWPLLLVMVALVISLLYRFGPSRDRPSWRWVTWGSAFAAVAWLVASLLFAWYAANFGSYNKTYGSLGAVIGFMTWMWISTIVVLLGATLNAEMEHQTARDTTAGAPEPMGQRGATMADTVGEAA